MKCNSTQDKVKAEHEHPVIPYPPGYKGQSLTSDLITFSEKLSSCPEEYRGIFIILLTHFAEDMGCGDSEMSREYLKAIANDGVAIWYDEDLLGVVFVSLMEECNNTRKRILKIMPTNQLAELSGDFEFKSDVHGDCANTDDTPTSAEAAEWTLH